MPELGSTSPAERQAPADSAPQVRVSLLRCMVLIAVVAACLAWVPRVMLPIIVVPVVVAAIVPKGSSWFVVETSTALGWLASAVVVFSTLAPAIDEGGLLFVIGISLAFPGWSGSFGRS